MFVQWCLKGIRGESTPGAGDGFTWIGAQDLVTAGTGILSRWWQTKGRISPGQVETVLTDHNLDRHIHDYQTFGPQTPFISLAAGSAVRDPANHRNWVRKAIDTALGFATANGTRPGAVYYCWVLVAHNPAVQLRSVAEEVRDLHTYRRWSPYQPEGEITAKVNIPANQIWKVEWWDLAQNAHSHINRHYNNGFVHPKPVFNMKRYF